MKQLTTTYHTLEQYGPRNQVWRSVQKADLPGAFDLAYRGSLIDALMCAETEYIVKHGDMHGVKFRIKSQTVTLTTIGPESDFNDYPLG